MQQGVLQFQFRTSVEERGFVIQSDDLADFRMFFGQPLNTEQVMDILKPAMKMHLWGYDLKPERHMIVLEDPAVDLSQGGTFTCVVVPKPL